MREFIVVYIIYYYNIYIKIDDKSVMKPATIALYVFFGIIAFLWFYTVYNVRALYSIYIQYLPPRMIVMFALGTVLITAYEAFRSFVSDSSNCLVVLILGAFAHTLHSASAFSTATYMYYEKMKTLKIKNDIYFLLLRVCVLMILEFMYIYLYYTK